MAKRKREEEDEEKPVFVNTNLDTNLLLLVSPLLSFSLLKELIVMEHSKCFPDFGEIEVTALKVKRKKKYYHVSGSMPVRAAFYGVQDWFVFTDVSATPFNGPQNAQSIFLGELEGGTHNRKSVVHNEENICRARGKKTKKRKKDGDDEADRSHAAKLDKGPDIMENDVAAFKNEKITLQRDSDGVKTAEEGTPPKPIGDSELPLPQPEALNSNEGERLSKKNVAPLKSSELKKVEKTSKKEKRMKSKNSILEKQDFPSIRENNDVESANKTQKDGTLNEFDGMEKSKNANKIDVDGVHGNIAARLMQNSVTALSERESESKTTAGEEIKESGKTSKKRKKHKIKTSVAAKEDPSSIGQNIDEVLADSRQEVAETSQPSSKPGQCPDMTSKPEARSTSKPKALKPIGDSELPLPQPEALYLNEVERLNNDNVVPLKSSGSKKIAEPGNTSKKKKTKKSNNFITEKQDFVSARENNDVESADKMQKGTDTIAGGILSEASLVEKTKNTREVDVDGVNGSVAAQLGQVPNIMQNSETAFNSVKFICERESDSKNPAEEEIKESGDISKKRKTRKIECSITAKEDSSSVRHNNDRVLAESWQEVAEVSQPVDSSKPAQSSDITSKLDMQCTSEQKTHMPDSSGFPLEYLLNEPMKEMDIPKTVDDGPLTNSSMIDNKIQMELGDGDNEQLSEFSVQKVSVQETDTRNREEKTTRKSKQKKLDQPLNVDTSPNSMTLNEGNVSERTSLVSAHEKLKEISANKVSAHQEDTRDLKKKKERKFERKKIYQPLNVDPSPKLMTLNEGYESELQNENLNEISTEKVAAHEEDKNVEKKTLSKFRRKKLDQPSSVDTSSNLMTINDSNESAKTSLIGHQIQNEKLNEISAEKLSAHEEDTRNLKKKTSRKSKRKKIDQPSNVDTSAYLVTVNEDCESERMSLVGHQLQNENLKEISTEKVSAHEEDMNLEKEAGKSKRKKLDLPSRVDTSSNLMILNEGYESERTSLIGHRLQNENSHEISSQKISAHEEDKNLENKRASKSKRKKLAQLSYVDTSSNLMVSNEGYESERTSTVAHQLQSNVHGAEQIRVTGVGSLQPSQVDNPEVDDEISIDKPKKKREKKHSVSNKSLSNFSVEQQIAAEAHKTVVEPADDVLNGNAIYSDNQEEVSLHDEHHSGSADVRKLDNQPVSELEVKKHDRPSSADALSKVDDVMPNNNVNDAGNQADKSLHEKRHDDSTQVTKLDNELASKLKTKKLGLSSSVDTSSNGHDLITSKKSPENETNVQVESELQNDVQESEISSQIGTKSLPNLDTRIIKVTKTKQKKPTSSANSPSQVEQPDGLPKNGNGTSAKHSKGRSHPKGHYNDSNEILSQKLSSGLTGMKKPEKLPAGKQKVKNLDQPTSVDADSKKENLKLSNKSSGIGDNSPNESQLRKSITEREHGIKPHSGYDNSTSSKEVMGAQVPVGDLVSSPARALGEHNPVIKSGLPLPSMEDLSRSSGTSSLISGSPAKKTHLTKNLKNVQKKTNEEHLAEIPSNENVGVSAKKHIPVTSGIWFGDLTSDSSDDEVERNISSCTRTPEDSSSSDYSEGESNGDVVTSQHDSKSGRSARDKTKVNMSAFKDMDFEMVLRSSSRYKKAKLAASQSQMEDSEPPDFVPDSQANP